MLREGSSNGVRPLAFIEDGIGSIAEHVPPALAVSLGSLSRFSVWKVCGVTQVGGHVLCHES